MRVFNGDCLGAEGVVCQLLPSDGLKSVHLALNLRSRRLADRGNICRRLCCGNRRHAVSHSNVIYKAMTDTSEHYES